MYNSDINVIAKMAEKKARNANEKTGKYIGRAVVTGFYIMVAIILSYTTGAILYPKYPEVSKVIVAATFCFAIALIVFLSGELFTGNNFVMAFGAFDKKVTWKDAFKIWGVSYAGNFIGCLILGIVFVLAGAAGTADYYAAFIPNKLSLGISEMFFRAILCNFFVCLGVLCGIKLKEEAAKVPMIILCIAAFVISGFEHCIANMGNFAVAYMLLPDLSLTAMLRSMVVVTIGNIIGGALALAWPLRKMSMDK